ncbi:DUF3887 domain-containing protein [Thermococcus sp.]
MNKKPLVALILLAFLIHPVTAAGQPDPNAFMKEFTKAVNTGNFSLIEHYMNTQLRGEFTESYFKNIREFILTNYGKVISFKALNESESKDMALYKFEVICEKGSFPVLLAYKNGELVGIALGVRAKPNPAGMVAMILGSFTALGILYFSVRKMTPHDLILGSGLALALSVIIPFYSIVAMFTISLYPTLERTLATALATALTVEIIKFYISRRRDGLSIGLGLGIGQYVLLAIGTFVAVNFILQLPVSFTGSTFSAFLVALAFTLFHATTARSYTLTKKPLYMLPFIAIEFTALVLMSSNMAYIGVAVVGLGVIIGARVGGVWNGISGRETP